MHQKLLKSQSAEARSVVLLGAGYHKAGTAPSLAVLEGSRRLITTCHLIRRGQGRPALTKRQSLPVSYVQMLGCQSRSNRDQVVRVPGNIPRGNHVRLER